MSDSITIIDVGPRDGLQNDAVTLAPHVRSELATRLLECGVDHVEAAAFVNPSRVPQMGGATKVIEGVDPSLRDRLTALVPNARGFEEAQRAGVRHVRFVLAASDQMNSVNFGADTEGSAQNLTAAIETTAGTDVTFGIVVGTAFGCPYEGAVSPSRVLELASHFAVLGATEVVLADTTGVANPRQVGRLCKDAIDAGLPSLGVHFHNTRNTGYANVLRAIDVGVRRFDSSIGGIGGCPFAVGASGNVATEDLVHMVEAMGLTTGVDLHALLEVSRWLRDQLGHDLDSQLLLAGPANTK